MKHKKLIAMSILASTMVVSVSADAVLQEVIAHFNPMIQYTLDGEAVLEGQGALVYNDSTYVPVRAIADALGVEVTYKDGVVSMKAPKVDTSIPATEIGPSIEVTTPVEEEFHYENMKVVEINTEDKSFVMAPLDAEDETLNVIVRTTEETSVAHYKNKAAYRFEDLTVGQLVSVKTTGVTTASLPAQTVAAHIVMVDVQEVETVKPAIPAELFETHPTLKEADYKNMEVVTMNLENQTLVMVPAGKDKTLIENHIVVHLSEDTHVAHYLNRRAYTIADIEEGQVVAVKTSGIATMSLPPQVVAEQVILVD